jgi:alpha-1,2-mannosyltransferase
VTVALQGGRLGPRSPGCGEVFCDAVGYYLPTFRALFATGLPSEGFIYPPFFALLGVPFGLLGTGFAWGWALFQLAAFVLLALAGARLLGGRWAFVYVVLLALAEPVLSNAVWGNVSVLLTGLTLAAAALDRAGRPRAGAAALGCAIAIKYYPGAFLLWWVARREWRFVGWTLAFALAFSALPVLALRPDGFLAFMRATSEQLVSMGDRNVLLSQAALAVLGRVTAYSGLPGLFLPALALLFGLLALAGLAFARAAREDDPALGFALLWLALPIVSGAVWPHYLAYLPFAQAVALREARGVAGPTGTVLTALSAIAAVASTWFALFAVGVAIYPAVGVAFFASALTLAAVVGAIMPRLRAPALP